MKSLNADWLLKSEVGGMGSCWRSHAAAFSRPRKLLSEAATEAHYGGDACHASIKQQPVELTD
jgi:hypothetical protein